MQPVLYQMLLKHLLAVLPAQCYEVATMRMQLRETRPHRYRFYLSALFVGVEWVAMVLAASCSIMMTFSFARLNYMVNIPSATTGALSVSRHPIGAL